jgi:hypothetical protein
VAKGRNPAVLRKEGTQHPPSPIVFAIATDPVGGGLVESHVRGELVLP